ncbi:unnamed protein product [Cylindrotheca closterium]|uniref:Uncharacterized protein n=1 Tax=Cylindrotheca closterium TaxID=2856 RepID=A0AAD2CLE8_9STRA|nr:unnamed protein product [Cylindrotheca closterium]
MMNGLSFARFSFLVGLPASVALPHRLQELFLGEKFHRIKVAIAFGLALQVFILPVVGWALVKGLDLNATDGRPLLFAITSPPGQIFAMLWCSLFNADLTMSIILTGLTNMAFSFQVCLFLLLSGIFEASSGIMLGYFLLPLVYLLVAFTSGDMRFLYLLPDVSSTLNDCATTNFMFIAFGALCGMWTRSTTSRMAANFFGNLAGLIVATDCISDYWSFSFWQWSMWNQDYQVYICVALVVAFRVLVASLVVSMAKLTRLEQISVVVQVCCLHMDSAKQRAIKEFRGPGNFLSVIEFYGFCQNMALALYCLSCWKLGCSRAKADDPLVKVICKSYEAETCVENSTITDELVGGEWVEVSANPHQH